MSDNAVSPQCPAMLLEIYEWGVVFVKVQTLHFTVFSQTGLCMPSADHEKRSYGETSTWQRLLAILSACMDKLKTILEQEEDYVGTRSKRNSKADKVAGSLLRQLALFEVRLLIISRLSHITSCRNIVAPGTSLSIVYRLAWLLSSFSLDPCRFTIT